MKRRIQLCKTQFNERERFLDHGMREYFRLSSTQTNRMSTFNAGKTFYIFIFILF